MGRNRFPTGGTVRWSACRPSLPPNDLSLIGLENGVCSGSRWYAANIHRHLRLARVCQEAPVSYKTEFSVQNAYRYDQRTALRWIVAHIWRYKFFALLMMSCYTLAWLVYARALLITDGLSMLTGSMASEQVASKIAADAREELYVSLLGKSQAFHDRQRVGDIMARATDDVGQLSSMIVPGVSLSF